MKIFILILFLALPGYPVFAQKPSGDSLKRNPSGAAAQWALYAEADMNLFPDASKNILTLVTTANRKKLHLEARYNYEDRNSASVFGGMNFTFGNKLKFILTPVAGVVFGRLNGAVPGLETNLRYQGFDFITQSEYILDFAGFKSDYLYTYMQLEAMIKIFAFGIAAQKNKIYETRRNLQLGGFAQYTLFGFNAKLSYYNPFSSDYFFTVTVDISF